MVVPFEEKPLEFRFMYSGSDTFWEEDFRAIPTSELFHFTSDISGRHAAITINTRSYVNFVSIEVVEKLRLSPLLLICLIN